MGAGLVWMFRTIVKASVGLEEGAKNWGGGTQVVSVCWPWRKKQLSLISMTGNSFTTCTKVLAHWGYAPISPCRITAKDVLFLDEHISERWPLGPWEWFFWVINPIRTLRNTYRRGKENL